MADVGCAGILVADTFCGPMAALPRPGHLLAVHGMPLKVGGCAANVAIDLAKQNLAIDVAGCVGEDPAANLVISCLTTGRVDCARVLRVNDFPTSTTVILLVEGEDRRYIHAFGANAAFRIGQIDRNWVKGLKVFYLGGLLAMPGIDLTELEDLLKFCRENKVTTVVDVVVPHDFTGQEAFKRLLPWIDYLTPNDDEALLLTGQKEPVSQLKSLLDWGAGTVIVTLGANGSIAGRGNRRWTAGAFPLATVVDPSGSGDAFTSGIVTGIVRDWDLNQTLPFAAALGASATRAVGTTDSVFTADEARDFLAKHPMRVSESAL